MTNQTALIISLAIVGLLLGGCLTYSLFPQEITKEVVKEVIKEVPVNVTIEKELIKEVNTNSDFYDKAKVELIKYMDKHDLLTCNNETYDKDQVSFSRIDKLAVDTSDEDETIVSLDARLKFLDDDVDTKCFQEISSEVTFEAGEKPVVEIL